MPRNKEPSQGYACYIEMIPMGRYVKVIAVDPVSGLEVSMMGDAKAPQAHLSQLASRKLAQRLLANADKKNS